jgi:Cystathionine beta-lyase family protein involved in aluminum resistance
LNEVIYGNGNGSLNDYNIKFEYIDMINNDIDIDKSIKYINANHPKYIYIQRSRGYNSRNALTLNYIETDMP